MNLPKNLQKIHYKKKMNLQNTNRFTDLENVLKVSRVEGWGQGMLGSLGFRSTHCYILKWITRSHCIAQGNLLHVTWQPA